jgi:hypothetical protein
MFAKIKDGQIAQYPYTIQQLISENSNVSFPKDFTDEILAQFDIVRVIVTGAPESDYTKNVNQADPVFVQERNRWEQTWIVTDATQEQIAERLAEQANQLKMKREEAYRNESDPLFFKAQRGESTQQEWLDKVAEIKARYI